MQVSDGWKEVHAIDSRREKLHGRGGVGKGESNLRVKTTAF